MLKASDAGSDPRSDPLDGEGGLLQLSPRPHDDAGLSTPAGLRRRYRFVRRLKSGQGIETVVALDLETGRDVVVKTTSSAVLSAEARLRLEHEVAILGGLRNPSLAPILDAGHEAGLLYVVMPFVSGVTLAERLRSGPLRVPDALTVARSLLGALSEVHVHGVLHCDVKPANVIIRPGAPLNEVTLIDFGLARSALLPAPVRDRPAGTARYMAPEQAGLLDRPVDERADLYSVGIVLFECLTGRPPFDGDTIGEVLRDQLSTPPPSMRSLGVAVPTAVEEIVQRLLRKDPDDRYGSAEAVLADVEAVADALRRGVEEPAIVVGCRDCRQTLAEPALVGRDADLAVLGGHLEDARQGSGRLLVLEGNSGVGKTRLLEEFSQRAIGSGAWVLRGQGVERVAPRPLQILAGVIADLMAATQSDPSVAEDIAEGVGEARNRVCEVLPELADALGGPPTEPAGPEAYAQTRSVAALVGLLDALGTPARPALVVLDDCQWADEITLRVLLEWAKGASGAEDGSRHVLVVAAVRPEELAAHSPLRTLPEVPHLELRPLAPDEVSQVVESMAGAVPKEAADIVLELSGGNPFMVSAVLRGLVEAGSLSHGEAGWRLERGPAGPRASREAAAFLARRLELLAPGTRQLLKAAAVLGRDFDLQLARVLAGQDLAATELAVAQAMQRHIIWKGGGDRGTFVHDRLREALLGALEPDELAALHLRAGEEIEAADPSRAFELAYHFDAAGKPTRALAYALDSGQAARARHDLELANRQYRIAERGLDGSARETRQEVAEALGQISMLRGQYDEAEQHLEAAVNLAADKVSSARIEGQLGELAFKRDQVEVAASRIEAALQVLGERVPRGWLSLVLLVTRELLLRLARRLNPVPRRFAVEPEEDGEQRRLTAHLLARLQYVWWFKRRRLATVWVMMRHLNVAERGGECPELAHIYAIHGAGMALTFPFLWRRGLHYTAKAIEIHERQGNLWGQGQAWSMRGCVLHAAGRFADGVEACGHGAGLLEQYGDPWELNFAGWNRALCLYRLGRSREAVDQARRTYRASVDVGDAQAETITLEIWARAAGGQVGAERVQAALRHGADIHSSAAALQADALRLRASGQLDDALLSMEKAATVVRASRSRNIYVTPVFPWLATLSRETAELAGSAATGRITMRRARRAARRAVRYCWIYRHDLPHALREAAIVAALSGRPRRARYLFDGSAHLAARHHALGEYAETIRQRQRLSIPAGRLGARTRHATVGLILDEDQLERVPTLGLADRFAKLLEAGGRLASAVSSDDIAAAVRETALTLLRAEHCVVVGLGSDGVDQNEPTRFLGRDLGRRAMDRRQPVILTEAVAPGVDPSDSVVLAGVRSALCAPILVRDEPVGYFLAVHSRVDCLFGPEEERLAEFIAHLAGAALERERLQHEIRGRVVIAQEAERARVARDLHDEVGQAVTSVLLGVRLVESSVQDPSVDASHLLTRISELRRVAGEALTTVQQLAFELRPTVLDDLGLVPALRRLVGDMASRHGLSIHLETGDLVTGDRLPSDAETTAYRVVQEALTNVVRHSKASMCSVVLARSRNNLRVVVEDDGIGFDQTGPGASGLGLRGMSERAALAGGMLRISSTSGDGTTIVLEVPLA